MGIPQTEYIVLSEMYRTCTYKETSTSVLVAWKQPHVDKGTDQGLTSTG